MCWADLDEPVQGSTLGRCPLLGRGWRGSGRHALHHHVHHRLHRGHVRRHHLVALSHVDGHAFALAHAMNALHLLHHQRP